MNILHSSYPGRYLMPEPMTDPPQIRSSFSERGLTTGAGPPSAQSFRSFLQLAVIRQFFSNTFYRRSKLKRNYRTSSPTRLAALLAGAALFGLVSQSALAAGTASGTTINNLAKLSYSVGGTAQNEICSSPTGNGTGNGGTSGTTCVS